MQRLQLKGFNLSWIAKTWLFRFCFLLQGSWWCERCKRTPNLCGICRGIVKGLFSWCQGCAHGGHLKCLRTWYARNTLCPIGCGHHCEYQWNRKKKYLSNQEIFLLTVFELNTNVQKARINLCNVHASLDEIETWI